MLVLGDKSLTGQLSSMSKGLYTERFSIKNADS